MKWLLLLFLIVPTFALAQSYESLKGVKYRYEGELLQLKSCIKVQSKQAIGKYQCSVYYDTIAAKHIIVIQKTKRRQLSGGIITILDIAEFDSLSGVQHLFVGSMESCKYRKLYNFIIAIDCCYQVKTSGDWPMLSSNIYKAWAFNKRTKCIVQLNVKNVSRIWEGFQMK